MAGTELALVHLTYYVIPLIFRREIAFYSLARLQPYLFASGMLVAKGLPPGIVRPLRALTATDDVSDLPHYALELQSDLARRFRSPCGLNSAAPAAGLRADRGLSMSPSGKYPENGGDITTSAGAQSAPGTSPPQSPRVKILGSKPAKAPWEPL